jgi:glucose-1-phosphatase
MTEKNKILAVIWDVGGVLVRTEDQTPRQQLAERLGITRQELSSLVFDSEPAIRATVGKGNEGEIWSQIAHHFSLNENEQAQVESEFWAGDVLDVALIAYIRKLRGSYRCGLLSNAWPGTRETLQKRFDFLDVFDVLVFSGEVGIAKPDPAIFQLVLGKLGVKADEAVFVDDFPDNIAGAQKLGIHTVHFRNQDQALTELEVLLGISR